MSLTLARIRAINAVAQSGSYAAAARALGVSQPTMAEHVRQAESVYSVRLFMRRDGVLHPTPLCLQLCDIAERMAEEEREAERIMTRHATLKDGRITIGLGNSMPGMAVIALFRKRYPSVEIAVETGSHERIIKAVLSRGVDVGILPDIPRDGRFRTETLVSQEVVALLHEQHALADKAQLTCRQLMKQPLIFRARGSSTQRVVDRAFAQAGLAPKPLLVLDARDAAYEAVANGIGVGFIWRHGTSRHDTVRRIPVAEMASCHDEAAFALSDESSVIIDAFMAAARTYGSFRSQKAQVPTR